MKLKDLQFVISPFTKVIIVYDFDRVSKLIEWYKVRLEEYDVVDIQPIYKGLYIRVISKPIG